MGQKSRMLGDIINEDLLETFEDFYRSGALSAIGDDPPEKLKNVMSSFERFLQKGYGSSYRISKSHKQGVRLCLEMNGFYLYKRSGVWVVGRCLDKDGRPVCAGVEADSATNINSEKPVRLLHKFEGIMSLVDLSDVYYALAYNVEDALLEAKMAPGVDYTKLDLFTLAKPLVAEAAKLKGLAFDFPANEVVLSSC